MQFIDTHTHLYDNAFGDAEGMDSAVRRALEAGVRKLIMPDESSATRKDMMDLACRWSGVVFPCLGLHPTELEGDWKTEMDSLDKELEACMGGDAGQRIVAIGETGMDLYWTKDNAEVQEEVFRRQIDWAIRLDLPLIIHAREATERIFKVLDSYVGRGLRGSFHAFSGSLETFRRLEHYGDWFVGIGGVVTFKNAGIAKILPDIPLDRIILETDSPYLTPFPHRGERNESSYIPLIAAFIAQAKGIRLENLAESVFRNSVELFKI